MIEYDFGDGNGLVSAHQHTNGGGWIADTAEVDETVFVGPEAKVFGNAVVKYKAKINDYAKVYGNALVYDKARIYGQAEIYGNAQVSDDCRISDNAKVYGNAIVRHMAIVTHNAKVYGNAIVSNCAEIYDDAQVCGNASVGNSVKIVGESIVSRNPKSLSGFSSEIVVSDYHISIGNIALPPAVVQRFGVSILKSLKNTDQDAKDLKQAMLWLAGIHDCDNRIEDMETPKVKEIIDYYEHYADPKDDQ